MLETVAPGRKEPATAEPAAGMVVLGVVDTEVGAGVVYGDGSDDAEETTKDVAAGSDGEIGAALATAAEEIGV